MRWDETSLPEVYGAARELTPEALATWRTTLPALVPASPTIRNVVDLGCGTGRFSRLLAELNGGAIIAIDPSVRRAFPRVLRDEVVIDHRHLRFFPEAMELERQRMPTRGALTRAFLDLGFTGARHLVVRQQIAENHSELLRRIHLRGLSSLAAISDAAFYRARSPRRVRQGCRTR